VLENSRNGEKLSRKELIYMLSLEPGSADSYLVVEEANQVSKALTGNKAEVHAQLSLNLAPCPCNCAFCAFSRRDGIFSKETLLTVEEDVNHLKQFEMDGATLFWDVHEGPSRYFSWAFPDGG
jgi:biotin synthase